MGGGGGWGLPLILTWQLFPGWLPALPVSSRCQCPEERGMLSSKASTWELGRT